MNLSDLVYLGKKNMKISINNEGFSVNDLLLKHNSKKEDVKRLFGDPDSEEPVNGFPYFRYDNIGIGIYFNEEDDSISSIGCDFVFRTMKHSPINPFNGVISIYGEEIKRNSTEDFFRSIINNNNLKVEGSMDSYNFKFYDKFLIIEPWWDMDDFTLLDTISFKIDEGYKEETGSTEFSKNDISSIYKKIHDGEVEIFLDCQEDYSGSYQTKNNISSGFEYNDHDFEEDYDTENSISEGDFDMNKKVFRKSYMRQVTLKLNSILLNQELELFLKENKNHDLENFTDFLGLYNFDFIESIYEENKLIEKLINNEKISDENGNEITFDEYDQYDGLIIKLRFENIKK